ncbi:AAA family ATPase [Sulfurimonas sp. RIFOXYB12_FULL_35_9]|uniref:AAA family ATPase n=1 Tax=Sulfurimonas sp. RIFOXYB12_FULL_35_9 TaxID=1802256 RepID=UPI0008AE7FD8|nr:AAA family ATPase [Sulfurimonas sp. RIFOXYB12_FULL_35_9]OHE04515.1 MAG: hypothetical protein A2345_02410 [Sulfurimonas sp. RIFOXYB12_FULL_35_9]
MELVYLWVEDYKNIKKQGFNFSPRFNIEFKPEYENKMCCDENQEKLSIKEDSHPTFTKNLNYREIDLVPKNISITAIVGENGSGKTAILREFLNIGDIEQIQRTKLYAYDKETDSGKYIDFETLRDKETQLILFDEDVDSLSHNNAYSIDHLIDIKDRYKKNNIVIALLGFDKELYTIGNLPYIPSHIEMALNGKIELDDSTLLGLSFEYDDDLNDRTGHISVSSSTLYNLKEFLKKELSKSIQMDLVNFDIKSYLYIKEFIYKLNNNDKIAKNRLRDLILSSFNDDTFIDTLDKNLYTQDREENFKLLIKRVNRFIRINGLQNQKITVGLNNPNVEQVLKNANRNFFDIEFFKIIENKSLYFKDLSSGEQKLVLLFGKLNYVVRKFTMEGKENYILLLDEPDIYLHPNWQKKLISYFINFIENNQYLNEKNIHIIIASHSPFILSDLPKENVIFLKNDEKTGNCKNVTKETNINTFGANIHTLLSHGFFMKDGLMGEFAKEKIQSIIKYPEDIARKDLIKDENKQLREEEKVKYENENKKNFWNIQSIIGDDYLKQVIKNHLIEIEKILYKDMYLDNEIERMKEELKKLEALKNA